VSGQREPQRPQRESGRAAPVEPDAFFLFRHLAYEVLRSDQKEEPMSEAKDALGPGAGSGLEMAENIAARAAQLHASAAQAAANAACIRADATQVASDAAQMRKSLAMATSGQERGRTSAAHAPVAENSAAAGEHVIGLHQGLGSGLRKAGAYDEREVWPLVDRKRRFVSAGKSTKPATNARHDSLAWVRCHPLRTVLLAAAAGLSLALFASRRKG
jgi:hypothetical protein